MHHKIYYVYSHKRLDTNEIFYIGIGKVQKTNRIWKHNTIYSRAYEKSKRSKFWKNVTSKTEFEVNIIYETFSKKEAISKEIEYINLYGRKCCDKLGTLVNISAGGEYNNGPKNRGIKITQKDLSGNVVKIWDELKYIEKDLGYLKTNIVKCCRKKQLTAYGYLWEYFNDRSYDNIRPSAARKKTNNNKVGLKVMNKTNKEIKNFNSIREAADFYGYHRSTIQKYLSKKTNNKLLEFQWNNWIENHNEQAREIGLSTSRTQTT
jgi:NUMOD1 domain